MPDLPDPNLTARGLVCTGHAARMILPCDQRHRLMTGFKQAVPKNQPFLGHAAVYGRARRLARARVAEMSCAHGDPLTARILGHMWDCIPGESIQIPVAALIMDLACPHRPAPPGEIAPDPDHLSVRGGTPRDVFSRLAAEPRDEFYNEYDTTASRQSPEPFSFSYGEPVSGVEPSDYSPYIARAESRAGFYHATLDCAGPLRILNRQWWTIDERLVVVVITFDAGIAP